MKTGAQRKTFHAHMDMALIRLAQKPIIVTQGRRPEDHERAKADAVAKRARRLARNRARV